MLGTRKAGRGRTAASRPPRRTAPPPLPPEAAEKGGVGDGHQEGQVGADWHGIVPREQEPDGQTDGQQHPQGRRSRPPPPEEEGAVGEPQPRQDPHVQQHPEALPAEVGVCLAVLEEPGRQMLEEEPRQQEEQHPQGQIPAVLWPVEPVQVPAYRRRVPHLGHRPLQGGPLLQALGLKFGGLIGDVVGELPQEGTPGPPPADFRPRSLQVLLQCLTRHRSRPLPAPPAPRRRRRPTAPSGPAEPPGRRR